MSERLDQLSAAAGRRVSRETSHRIDLFLAEFHRWAGRINLVAPSTLAHVWTRHVLDSAQLAGLAPEACRWIDIGSGGGFPGAVVAILLAEREGTETTLIESNAKKAAFLRTALGLAGVKAEVEQARIEQSRAKGRAADVVSARALAPLGALLGLASPWLEAGATGLFHKGRDYRSEVDESRDAWHFDLLEHRSIADAESVVLEIRNLRRKRQA